jgi:sec-independent protein translocase protein TatA|tara:strand:+ start:704 stop:922 length:219 start_codon:yes stop_codon:yes gene_type:complete
MSIGFWQIAIVVVLVVLLFGRGKISSLMGDVAKGIKSFKKGMSDNPDQSTSASTSTSSSEDTSNKDQNSENK